MKYIVERQVTLSHYDVLETSIKPGDADINYVNQLANKHFKFGSPVIVKDVSNSCGGQGYAYEIHQPGVVVRPNSTFLGFIFVEED